MCPVDAVLGLLMWPFGRQAPYIVLLLPGNERHWLGVCIIALPSSLAYLSVCRVLLVHSKNRLEFSLRQKNCQILDSFWSGHMLWYSGYKHQDQAEKISPSHLYHSFSIILVNYISLYFYLRSYFTCSRGEILCAPVLAWSCSSNLVELFYNWWIETGLWVWIMAL